MDPNRIRLRQALTLLKTEQTQLGTYMTKMKHPTATEIKMAKYQYAQMSEAIHATQNAYFALSSDF